MSKLEVLFHVQQQVQLEEMHKETQLDEKWFVSTYRKKCFHSQLVARGAANNFQSKVFLHKYLTSFRNSGLI